jgi:chemotaxis signal transduction protein
MKPGRYHIVALSESNSCYASRVMSKSQTDLLKADLLKAVMARAGDSWCALPLTKVRRVIRSLKLYPLPGSGEEIAGLAEVDGEPIVVLSLERVIGAPPGPSAEFPATLLVEVGDGGVQEVLGLAVDEAGDIVDLKETLIVGPAQGLVRGETHVDKIPVRVIDLAELGRTA